MWLGGPWGHEALGPRLSPGAAQALVPGGRHREGGGEGRDLAQGQAEVGYVPAPPNYPLRYPK